MVRRVNRKAAPKRGRPAHKIDQKLVTDLVIHFLQERANNRHVSSTCCNLNLSSSNVSVSSFSSVSTHASDSANCPPGIWKAVRAALRHEVKRGMIEQCPNATNLFRIVPRVSKPKPVPSKYVQTYRFIPDDNPDEGVDGPSDDQVPPSINGRQCKCKESAIPVTMDNCDDTSADVDSREVLTPVPSPDRVCTAATDVPSCTSHQKQPPPRYCKTTVHSRAGSEENVPVVGEEWLKNCRYQAKEQAQRRSARGSIDDEEEYEQEGRFRRARERSPTPWRYGVEPPEDPATSRPRAEPGWRNPIPQMLLKRGDQGFSNTLIHHPNRRGICRSTSVSPERSKRKCSTDDLSKQSGKKRPKSGVKCAHEVGNCDCNINNDPSKIVDEKVSVINDDVCNTKSKNYRRKVMNSNKEESSNNDERSRSKCRRDVPSDLKLESRHSRSNVDEDVASARTTTKRQRALSRSLSPTMKVIDPAHHDTDCLRIRNPSSISANIGNMKVTEAQHNMVPLEDHIGQPIIEHHRGKSRCSASSCEDCNNTPEDKEVKRLRSDNSKRSADCKNDSKRLKTVRFSDEVQTYDDNDRNNSNTRDDTNKWNTRIPKNRRRKPNKSNKARPQQQTRKNTNNYRIVPILKRKRAVNGNTKRGRRKNETSFKPKRPKKEFIMFHDKSACKHRKCPCLVKEDCYEENIPKVPTSCKRIFEEPKDPHTSQVVTLLHSRASTFTPDEIDDSTRQSPSVRSTRSSSNSICGSRQSTSRNFNTNHEGTPVREMGAPRQSTSKDFETNHEGSPVMERCAPRQSTSKDFETNHEGSPVIERCALRQCASKDCETNHECTTVIEQCAPRPSTPKNLRTKHEATPMRKRSSSRKSKRSPTPIEEDTDSASQASIPAKVKEPSIEKKEKRSRNRRKRDESLEVGESDSTHSCFKRWAMRRPMLVPATRKKKCAKGAVDAKVKNIPPDKEKGRRQRSRSRSRSSSPSQ